MSTYSSSAIMDHTSDRAIMPVDISEDHNSEDDYSEDNNSDDDKSDNGNSEGSNSEDDSSEGKNSVSQSGDSNSEDEDVEEFPVHTLTTAERNRMYALLAHEVEKEDILGSWQFATGKGAIFTNFSGTVDPLFYRPDIPSGDHSGLGTLNRLPQELIQIVVSEMDILSLIRFRRVNRSARAQVASNLDYRLVIENNPTSFLALIKAGLAPRFTIRQLATKLGQFECDICPPGNHGFLLFLPALARCCLDCITNSPKLCVWERIANPATPMLPQQDQRRVLKIVELLYLDPLEPVSFRPVPLPDRPAPPRELRVRGPDLPLLREYGPDMERWLKEKYRYMACAVIENLDRHNPRCLVLPRQCIGCHIRTGVGPDTVLNNNYLIDISGPNIFSRDTFIEHFKRCKHAQVLWEKVQQGMIIRRPTPRRTDNPGEKIARADELRDVWDEIDEEEQEEWMALWLKPATNNETGATEDDAMVIEDEAGDTPDLPIVLD
ncbi:hypothetical protein QBC37DRAFT_404878 [Rhypophila decipiens]|uniref:F-box domain-containing protein n=1 Tax=Rhypophila decipiens TaxID=261697 RepID=A0AAN6Y2E8_9PEZI|nr:hypothetical protein QBC37DRAFT_404878 [Rhypophila decipiens]